MEGLRGKVKERILIIKDIHRYDILEEAVAELLDVDNELISYDKLPDTFINPNDWPTRTNLCCAYDGEPFESSPVFIPLTIKPDGSMKPLGCFCDYPCAVAYAMNERNYDDEKRDELLKNLCKLYKMFTLNHVEYILPADSVLNIDKYGGELTVQQWRKNQQKHIMNYLPV